MKAITSTTEIELKERILLMGGPGTGKSHQLIKTISYLGEKGIRVYVIDLEDKITALFKKLNRGIPSNVLLYVVPYDWEDTVEVGEEILKHVKPADWIMVDRADLSWTRVQRWYSQKKFKESLADRMLEADLKLSKKAMFIPKFEQGSWLTINEQYDSFIPKLLYRSGCNVMMTAGIREIAEDNPMDTFLNLGVAPRGQKELQHQPHSAFLLYQKIVDKKVVYYISTAKDDMPDRPFFSDDEIESFPKQYFGGELLEMTKERFYAFTKSLGKLPSELFGIIGVKDMSEITDYKEAYDKLVEALK